MGSLYIQSCATYLKACQNGCYAKYGILWKENLLLWTSTFHLYSYFKFCKSCCWLNRGLCSIFFRHQIFLLLFVYYLYYEYLSKIFGKISNIYYFGSFSFRWQEPRVGTKALITSEWMVQRVHRIERNGRQCSTTKRMWSLFSVSVFHFAFCLWFIVVWNFIWI